MTLFTGHSAQMWGWTSSPHKILGKWCAWRGHAEYPLWVEGRKWGYCWRCGAVHKPAEVYTYQIINHNPECFLREGWKK